MRAVTAETSLAWATHLGVEPGSIDSATLRANLVAGSLSEAFEQGAQSHPESTLQVGETVETHSALQQQVARIAADLMQEGVTPGSRVIFCAPTSMSFVTAYLAALWAGATIILANPAYSDAELHNVVGVAKPRLLVADNPRDFEVPTVRLADLTGRSGPTTPAPRAHVTSQDVALLAFTSGTTGAPKGVPLTHGNLLSSIRAAMWAWRWSADDTLIHALPLFHQHGLSGLHAALLSGSNIRVLDQFDPHKLIAAAAESAGTLLFAVPSIHQRLVGLSAEELAVLSRMRLITSGSAPLSPDLEDTFNRQVGTHLLQRYGLTESGLNVSNPYDGDRIVGSVGFALPGVEVELFTSKGEPAGDEGEICLRGPQVFSGYLDDPAATEAAFWPDGWFRTGDLGSWVGDRLVITGRLKDLIISGGMNVTPGEVELVLEKFPGVAQAAVGGLPNQRWGEEVAAWIVVGDAVDAPNSEELIAHCRSQLAAYKCPKRVFLVRELPRNAMGKIVRSQLSELRPE